MSADVGQIAHIARLSVLAMCARGVGVAEFDSSPEVVSVQITVNRSESSEPSVDVEFVDAHGLAIGGMAL